MKLSEIRFHIELDDENVPDKIFWNATDSPHGSKMEEAKAINLSIWDHQRKETLRIDLWTKDMDVLDMKRCVIDTIGGLAETIRTATDDDFMAEEMHKLCHTLVQHLKKEAEGK
jgi:gliding motility-associated protein GldC